MNLSEYRNFSEQHELHRRSLTGKRRFKQVHSPINGFVTPVLMLQVEYTEFTTTVEGKPGRWVCMWRDATPEDVTEDVI